MELLDISNMFYSSFGTWFMMVNAFVYICTHNTQCIFKHIIYIKYILILKKLCQSIFAGCSDISVRDLLRGKMNI